MVGMITNFDTGCKESNEGSPLHKGCGGRLIPLVGEGDYLYLSQRNSHEVLAERRKMQFWQCDRCGLKGELV